MDCIFCEIAAGNIPAKKVFEDDDVIAFLDVNPASFGHTLVVPKQHVRNFMEADAATIGKVSVWPAPWAGCSRQNWGLRA